MAEPLPFWSDDFDMDLLKVLPEVARWCERATRPLYVHAHQTHGRLNSPTAWNHNHGLICFFSFDRACPAKPDSYYTGSPIVECSLLEALRDLWAHQLFATLDGYPLWDSAELRPSFDALMAHRRGWRLLPLAERDAHLARARTSIQLAIQRFETEDKLNPVPSEILSDPGVDHGAHGLALEPEPTTTKGVERRGRENNSQLQAPPEPEREPAPF